MKKLTSKLLAFALVAVLAFALTGCFTPNANTAITFNKYPEATYEVGADANSALSAIEVTLTENGVVVKKGNLADLEKEGVIVVEGFDLATEGANKIAKVIFGTAVVNFNYSVVAKAVEVDTAEELANAFANATGSSIIKLVGDITLTEETHYEVTSHVVLDLGANLTNTVANATRLFEIREGGKLEVKGNGTITNTHIEIRGIFAIRDGGELLIHSGNFIDYGCCSPTHTTHTGTVTTNGSTVSVYTGGVATIYGGTIEVRKPVGFDDHAHIVNNAWGRYAFWVDPDASLKIYDGNFKQDSAVAGNGSGYGSYLVTSSGHLFIYGGEFESTRGGIASTGGSFDIRGGKFTVTKEAYAFYIAGNKEINGIVSGGEFTSAGSCVVDVGDSSISEHAAVTVVITGGTFTSTNKTKDIFRVSDKAIAGEKLCSVEVKGGIFNADLEKAVLSEGYKTVEADGSWTVVAE